MKKTFVAVLASVLLAASAGVASAQAMHQHAAAPAQGPGMGAGMGAGMGMGMGRASGCPQDCPYHGMGKGMGMMGKGGMGGGVIHLLMMNAEELKLTDEQIGKLHRMMWKNMESRQALRTKLRDTKKAVRAAMMDPSKDDAAVRAAAKAHTDAFNAKIDASLKERAAAMAVLTDAQKKQAATLKPKKPMMGNPAPDDDTDD